ncbi:MAG: 4-oxalomesaconate tautomerase [Litorivicinaceae bacterium]
MRQRAIPCWQFRGGSSKGIYFKAADLPSEDTLRNQVILHAVSGSTGADKRQVDGLGGAHPLTSKVAVVGPSTHPEADIDYLFVQVVVGQAAVDTSPNCGNILSGIGAFALETGMMTQSGSEARIRVHMVNSGNLCELVFPLVDGLPDYDGDCRIDGVPGTAAPIVCRYADLAGSACGALLPTGSPIDVFDGVAVTCIDNGMPVVVMKAEDLGISGYESAADLNQDETLKAKVESIRLQAGLAMGLGDVTDKVVPKMSLVSRPSQGGTLNTRTFIPKVCHDAIGVLGAVSVASAAVYEGSPAHQVAEPVNGPSRRMVVEHPSGDFIVDLELDESTQPPTILTAGLLRTTRLLASGVTYVPQSVWPETASPSEGSL